MSIAALNWIFGAPRRGEPGLNGPTGANRHVLLAIANHANEDGLSWPSIDTIAREANVTTKTVKASLRWLEDGGYVTRNVQGAPAELMSRPQAKTNLYRLVFEAESGGEISGSPQSVPGGEIHGFQGGKSTDKSE